MVLTSVAAAFLAPTPAGAGAAGSSLAGRFGLAQGFPPAAALIIGNLFLWQRATVATSRDVGAFSVGVSFRLGMILLIVTLGLYSVVRRVDAITLVWLYFSLGLLAVAIARIHEQAEDAQSAGKPLPLHRLGQLLLAVGVTVGGAGLLSLVYTPGNIRVFLGWFWPLWRVLGWVTLALLTLLAYLLNPLIPWLQRQVSLLFNSLPEQLKSLLQPLGEVQQARPGLPHWVQVVVGNAFLALLGLALLAMLLGFLLLYLEKVRRSASRRQGEEADAEAATFGGGILNRGLRSLQDMAALLRRFGLGRQLLAAVSVQNIYANLCRLARQRGHPRPSAQPPDDYLPTLARVFPGQEEPLGRITAAYMAVHYGDHPVTLAELAGLRADYRRVRESVTG